MRIFITAITSFLGSSLAAVLRARGHEVTGSDRRTIRLGEAFDGEALQGQNAVVHCAHDFSANSKRSNVEGTKAIFRAAKETGVSRQVFVSSYSARPGACSEYGRIKWEIEDYFLEQGQIVVRPGLVIGNGGLFGRNMRTILRSPVLPLVDGGRDLVPFIAVTDVAAAMAFIVESGDPRAYNLFTAMVMLRQLAESLNRLAGRRACYLSIPLVLAAKLLAGARALGIKLPVGEENLRALKSNRGCLHQSDLAQIISRPLSLDEALDSALESLRKNC